MANEAVIVELLGDGGNPVEFTVADGATIEKGTILKLNDPRTAIASSGLADQPAGIAAAEKVASDGSTTLAAYTKGIFDLRVDGTTVLAGNPVMISGANFVALASAAAISSGAVLGYALESAASGTAETIQVMVDL